MPNYDGTGPCGTGPLTGRGDGPCNAGPGTGFGRGMRRRCCEGGGAGRFGFGRAAALRQPPTLAEQETILKAELDAVRKARKEQEDKS